MIGLAAIGLTPLGDVEPSPKREEDVTPLSTATSLIPPESATITDVVQPTSPAAAETMEEAVESATITDVVQPTMPAAAETMEEAVENLTVTANAETDHDRESVTEGTRDEPVTVEDLTETNAEPVEEAIREVVEESNPAQFQMEQFTSFYISRLLIGVGQTQFITMIGPPSTTIAVVVTGFVGVMLLITLMPRGDLMNEYNTLRFESTSPSKHSPDVRAYVQNFVDNAPGTAPALSPHAITAS